ETPYHKGTEHHIGKLRAKLARLKDKLIQESSKKGSGGGGYAVKKQGDATIILIGPPSAGKSTLLNALTNAKSKVAPYSFTTVSVIPGMLLYKDARIQILDVPGLIEGAEEGKGRGREVLSVARGADLIILMTDIQRLEAIERIQKALERNGIRLNIVRPNVVADKKTSGGIAIHSNIKQDISFQTIKEVTSEMGIKNADITINEKLTMDRLIDTLSPNRVYLPIIYVLNKIDEKNTKYDKCHYDDSNHHSRVLTISAEKGIRLEELKEKIWEILGFVRVYLVRSAQEPDFNHPLVVKKGMTLSRVANKIGTEFAEDKKRAKIWGPGAKFPGQEVSLSTQIQERMQVRFI
ncbi:hypothetical protein A3H19_05555, partial [Candidatus Woesebacteria bacterium RIFCSPLOWO2_12_FULL_39_9]